jgi:hypothetical protein
LFAADAHGNSSLQAAGSGMSVVSGAELSAGIAPATLKLYRGGEVRLCSRTGVSVSAGGHGLMLATGVGALEVNYQLTQDSVDVLITPDFNVTLVGPGTFHFSLELNKKGDTCVKPLAGNTSEIAFTELLGSGTYKVKADEAVFFPGGKLQQTSSFTGDCGCPPTAPVMRAEAAPSPTPTPAQPQNPASAAEHVAVASSAPASATPPDHPGDVHVEVDAPFVFSARPAGPSVARLQVSSLPNVFFMQEQVDPVVLTEKQPEVSAQAAAEPPKPAAETPRKEKKEKAEKKGFMGRVKGFFGSLFHR